MNLDHIALAYSSEKESDTFFITLLGCTKTRSFTVSSDLMERFFGITKEQEVLRYEKDNVSFEVFITNDESRARDTFTHACLIIENREELINNANVMGFETIKVPRKNDDGHYLFLKDSYRNLYEIK
ncbi:MAG: VOC family protein [Promethearchaeota archaeon]